MLIKLIKTQDMLRIDTHMLNTLKFFVLIVEASSQKNGNLTNDELKTLKKEVNAQCENIFQDLILFKQGDTWLLNRMNRFNDTIKDVKMREEFVQYSLHDIEYSNNISNSNFRFKTTQFLKRIDEEMAKIIVNIFKDLYKHYFSQKVEIGGRLLSKREEYINVFFNSNNNLLLCPSCLGELNTRTLQLDHYFPQSKFPILSIHPSNIVPICSTCNTSMGTNVNAGKGEKIPLDLSLPENNGISLENIYFPYESSGHMKFVGRVEFIQNSQNKTIEPYLLEQNSLDQTRLNGFSELFNLKNNWSSKIPYIHLNLMTKASIHFQMYVDNQTENKMSREEKVEHFLTINNISAYLFNTYIVNHNQYVLELPDVMITSSYVMWLLEAKPSLDAFVMELKLMMRQEEEMETPYFYKPHIYSEL